MSDKDLIKFLLMAAVAALEGNWIMVEGYLQAIWQPARERAVREREKERERGEPG